MKCQPTVIFTFSIFTFSIFTFFISFLPSFFCHIVNLYWSNLNPSLLFLKLSKTETENETLSCIVWFLNACLCCNECSSRYQARIEWVGGAWPTPSSSSLLRSDRHMLQGWGLLAQTGMHSCRARSVINFLRDVVLAPLLLCVVGLFTKQGGRRNRSWMPYDGGLVFIRPLGQRSSIITSAMLVVKGTNQSKAPNSFHLRVFWGEGFARLYASSRSFRLLALHQLPLLLRTVLDAPCTQHPPCSNINFTKFQHPYFNHKFLW